MSRSRRSGRQTARIPEPKSRHDPPGQALCLVENQKRLGPYTVMLHGLSRLVGLHEALECGHVGDFDNQTDPIGALRVAESTYGDPHRSEDLLALGRAQPVLDVVDLVKYDVGSQRPAPPSHGEMPCSTPKPGLTSKPTVRAARF